MSTVLAAHGYEVVSTDIADCGFGTPGVDFLASRSVREGCRSIITNPPYGEAAVHEGQARSSEGDARLSAARAGPHRHGAGPTRASGTPSMDRRESASPRR